MERLIYTRVEPIVDPLLPQEQAGFRRGRSTVDQVTLLTQKNEDSFSAKKKAGAVFVNLTAAYDAVWHRGLTCKLLRLLQTGTCYHSSWSLSAIVASTSLPAMAHEADYDVWETASHRAQSWHPSYLTSTCMIYKKQLPGRRHLKTRFKQKFRPTYA